MLEVEGKAHYVGTAMSILQNQGDWWGEGDDMIFIDDRSRPAINGTGSEDYFLGAWCYGGCGLSPFGDLKPTFSFSHYGNPVNGGDHRGSEWSVYRFHTDSPIPFEKYFKMTIEHGHANHRSDNYYSVAYWYQEGSHKLRKPCLPLASESREASTSKARQWESRKGRSCPIAGKITSDRPRGAAAFRIGDGPLCFRSIACDSSCHELHWENLYSRGL